ncbi:MATE efflux family protein [Dorea longicatena]|nr:MATE efflux family protein [Dorea longicatena]
MILCIFGVFCCRWMMSAIHTPENIMAEGILYLRIYVFGFFFLMFYNVCTGVFTAWGDSKTPLYFLIGSSVYLVIQHKTLEQESRNGFHWGLKQELNCRRLQ